MIRVSIFSLLVSTVVAQQDVSCPVGYMTMAGAEAGRRVVEAWWDAYTVQCPGIEIQTGGGGYAAGAARVCDNHLIYGPVDIAAMSGPFFSPQATTKNGWEYDCKKSDRDALLVRCRICNGTS